MLVKIIVKIISLSLLCCDKHVSRTAKCEYAFKSARTHRGLLTSAFLFLALFHGAQEKHGKLVTAPCTAQYSGEWLHNYLWSLCTPWYAYKILWICRQGRCAVDSSLLACFAGLQWGFCWQTARSLTGINLHKCALCLAFCIHVPNFLLTKYQTFIVKKYSVLLKMTVIPITINSNMLVKAAFEKKN